MIYQAWCETHLRKLQSARNGWSKALCPLHDDRTPSLQINLATGGWKCWACDKTGHLRQLAEQAGLPTDDLPVSQAQQPKKPKAVGELERVHEYLAPLPNAEKLVLTVKVFRDPDTREKTCLPFLPDGSCKNLPAGKRPLSQANRLVKAEPGQVVYVNEGEQKAEYALALGFLGTSASGGAGQFNLVDPAYLELLRPHHVVILPDNNEAGENHANQVGAILLPIARSVRILRLPGLPAKGDLVDWVKAGGTREQLEQLTADAPPWTPPPPKDPPGPDDQTTTEKPGFNFARTDLGNAEFLASQFGQDLAFLADAGTWLAWDGYRWRRDLIRSLVGHLTNQTARQRLADAAKMPDEKEYKREVAWALQSESAKGRDATLRQATTLQQFHVLTRDLDANPFLLACQNGTLNLETGAFRAPARADHITKLARVVYQANATCPLWLRFLNRVLPCPELRAYLQRAVGYSLTGSTGEECMFLLHGGGRNGKGTVVETIGHLLGEYSRKLKADLLLQVKNINPDGATPYLAQLQAVRFAHATESDDGKRLAEAFIKETTGGDTITARMLRENPVEFKPTHKLWLSTNYKPRVSGADEGIWSRIQMVPFNERIPEAERDGSLKEKLRLEAAGILNWALEGCLAWRSGGLNPPAAVRAATQAYRAESDILSLFVAEACVRGGDFKAGSQSLYNAYCKWLSGDKPFSQRRFSENLSRLGFTKRHTEYGSVWSGIGLLTTTDGSMTTDGSDGNFTTGRQFYSHEETMGSNRQNRQSSAEQDIFDDRGYQGRCTNPGCGNGVNGMAPGLCGRCQESQAIASVL